MAASVSETELADLHRQIANMEKQVLTLVAQATDPSRSAEAQSNASALALTCHKKLHKLEAQRMFFRLHQSVSFLVHPCCSR